MPAIDRDANGLVDDASYYTLVTDDGGLLLQEWKGRRYSDRSTPRWDAVHAVQRPRGFDVLLEGEGSRQGKYRLLGVNDSGRIHSKTRWNSRDAALEAGWEDIFGDVIRVDGVKGPVFDVDGDGSALGSTLTWEETIGGYVELN